MEKILRTTYVDLNEIKKVLNYLKIEETDESNVKIVVSFGNQKNAAWFYDRLKELNSK